MGIGQKKLWVFFFLVIDCLFCYFDSFFCSSTRAVPFGLEDVFFKKIAFMSCILELATLNLNTGIDFYFF